MDTVFERLAESPLFAEFTELLVKMTGLVMALNSPEGAVRQSYGPRAGNPLCRFIRADSEGRLRCERCDRLHYKSAAAENKSLLYRCHAGFWDMAVPVTAQGRHIATISSGQVLSAPPSEEGFRRLLTHLPMPEAPKAALRRAYFKSPYMDREKIHCVMRLLELFARQLCESIQRIDELEARLDNPEIRCAKEFVEINHSDPSTGLSGAAAAAGLSAAHFSHVFKQRTGKSFVRFLQETRIKSALKLMRGTEKSITQICFECGFNSLTNFNRVFRKITGRGPREFRREITGGGGSLYPQNSEN
jgi:AraC-like DNA-binding protein